MSSIINADLRKRAKRYARMKKFNALPDDTMFFFSSYGFVGNSINLWALGGSGYTTDPTKAQQYDKKRTMQQLSCNRPQDRFYLVSEVLANMSYHIDAQKIKTTI